MLALPLGLVAGCSSSDGRSSGETFGTPTAEGTGHASTSDTTGASASSTATPSADDTGRLSLTITLGQVYEISDPEVEVVLEG